MWIAGKIDLSVMIVFCSCYLFSTDRGFFFPPHINSDILVEA